MHTYDCYNNFSEGHPFKGKLFFSCMCVIGSVGICLTLVQRKITFLFFPLGNKKEKKKLGAA